MLFGHLVVSALQHHYLNADLRPAMIAGIFPPWPLLPFEVKCERH